VGERVLALQPCVSHPIARVLEAGLTREPRHRPFDRLNWHAPNGPETIGHGRRDDCHPWQWFIETGGTRHVSCPRKLSGPTLASRSIQASLRGEPPRDLIGMLLSYHLPFYRHHKDVELQEARRSVTTRQFLGVRHRDCPLGRSREDSLRGAFERRGHW